MNDNGLESTNKVIKDTHTLRERMPVGQYLGNACEMIQNWSLDRFPRNGVAISPFDRVK